MFGVHRILKQIIGGFSNRKGRVKSVRGSEAVQIYQNDKTSLLKDVSAKLNLHLQPPVFLQDESVKRRLTGEQKHQLGLFIPRSPFNTRLSRRLEREYLPTVTTDLYRMQKEHLKAYIRILQNNHQLLRAPSTLDQYINIIYKDIYARYLVSKEVGVEWEGFYANTGVMNGFSEHQFSSQASREIDLRLFLDFVGNNSDLIKKENTIGLFSFRTGKFVNAKEVGVEKVKRLGYYIKEEITSFGRYQSDFSGLRQRGGHVSLLIMVERLEKLFSPNAICIQPEEKFIIIKKYQPNEQVFTDYLILSLETFKKREDFLKKDGYQKHQVVDGRYLVDMKCNHLPIIPQIQGYHRESNAYLVNSNCHLSDFQRAEQYGLPHYPPFFNSFGEITLDSEETIVMQQPNRLSSPKKYSIPQEELMKRMHSTNKAIFHLLDSAKVTKSLQKYFELEKNIKFLPFYDAYDDEQYYLQTYRYEPLYFRIGEKYTINIPASNVRQIYRSFERQKTVISESKIVIPITNPGKKPRDRRNFRKERKKMLGQTTQHYDLEQSLKELNSISISSLSKNEFSVPLFLKEQKVVPYEKVLKEQQLKLLMQGKGQQIKVYGLKSEGIEMKIIFANEQLLKALSYLQNLTNSKDILNVIIEPQSETQELLPYAIHINHLINKGKTRVRRGAAEAKSSISLIKLHPTLSDEMKNIDVKVLIEGAMKSNATAQYGFGYEALRLWTASNDLNLGDRRLEDEDINMELQHSHAIRTVFWNLLGILPNEVKEIQPKTYLSAFILDSIDSYISNMELHYKNMEINKAYMLTKEFFDGVISEIFAKTIREKVIAFPNAEENQQYFWVIKRILELVAVISPLFPFTACHISKRADLKWPSILNPNFYERIPTHNEMIKLRTDLTNKLRLNRLSHSMVYVPEVKQAFSERDLEVFLGVKEVVFTKPDVGEVVTSLKLGSRNRISNGFKLEIYNSHQHCIRCDQLSKNTDHLCGTCVDYLQDQIGQPMRYFPVQIRAEIEPAITQK